MNGVMLRVAAFDLETTSLNANFGVLLCAVVWEQHQKRPMVFRADEMSADWERGRRSDDSAIVTAVAAHLEQFDVLLAHNGVNFDIPFLRTRMAHHNMGTFSSKKIIDPYQIAKKKFRMSSNSLDSLLDLVDTSVKTRVSGQLWLRAALDGDKEALDYITDHCVKDVQMLIKLVDVVKGYATAINSAGSGW